MPESLISQENSRTEMRSHWRSDILAPLAVTAVAILASHVEAVRMRPTLAILLTIALVCASFAVRRRRTGWSAEDALALGVSAALVVIIAFPIARLWLIDHPVVAFGIGGLIALLLSIRLTRGWQHLRKRSGKQRWRLAAEEIMPSNIVGIASAELLILRYAFGWFMQVRKFPDSIAFTYHRNMVPMIVAFLAIAVVEAALVHIFVSLWSRAATWVLFIIADVAVIYLIGFVNSMRKLPILVSDTGIEINMGLLIRQWIPIENVDHLTRRIDDHTDSKGSSLKASLLAHPSVYIRLVAPMQVLAPFGRARMVDTIGVHPDDTPGFIKTVNDILGKRFQIAADVG